MSMDIEKSSSSENSLTLSELLSWASSTFDDAESLEDGSKQDRIKAADYFKQIIEKPDPKNETHKFKEDSIIKLGKIYATLGDSGSLRNIFVISKPFFDSLPKSRVGKIVRSLIDVVGSLSSSVAGLEQVDVLEVQASASRDAIAWCSASKRTFLSQRIQCKLASVYLLQRKYNDALTIIGALVRAVKKFDDKLLLVEIQLIESRVHLALENVPKAKGALTSARSSANAIYCPPLIAAEIDLQAGILCAAEADFRTAFSYFFESFEGFNTVKDNKNSIRSLKYMLLSKIMMSQYEDVYSIINGKAGVKYSGIEMEALRAVADAYKARSVDLFESVKTKYKQQLTEDPVIETHLTALRSQLLEQNLLRLVEPYSRVELSYIASLIHLPVDVVVPTLSSMILDGKLNGILDQGTGDLLVFETTKPDKTYTQAIETIKELNTVVDRLYQKAKRLTN